MSAARKLPVQEVPITLTIPEVAAISQRALAEKLAGDVGGVFSELWRRVEKAIEDPAPKLKIAGR